MINGRRFLKPYTTQFVRLGALGDKEEEKKADGTGDEDPEIAEARREAEEKRNEKYRKIEEERERVRQDIRDKVLFSL